MLLLASSSSSSYPRGLYSLFALNAEMLQRCCHQLQTRVRACKRNGSSCGVSRTEKRFLFFWSLFPSPARVRKSTVNKGRLCSCTHARTHTLDHVHMQRVEFLFFISLRSSGCSRGCFLSLQGFNGVTTAIDRRRRRLLTLGEKVSRDVQN